jgi:hypothetical protein
MKGCLKARLKEGDGYDLIDFSLVEDDHEYGLDIEGYVHIPFDITVLPKEAQNDEDTHGGGSSAQE